MRSPPTAPDDHEHDELSKQCQAQSVEGSIKRTAIVGMRSMGITNAKAKTTMAWTTSLSFRGWLLDRSHMTGALKFAVEPGSPSNNARG